MAMGEAARNGRQPAQTTPTAPVQPAAPKAPTTPAPAPVPQGDGPFVLPSDAKLYNNGFGVFAVFDVGDGVLVSYGVNWWDGSVKLDSSAVQSISPEAFSALGAVDGGNAEELKGLSFGGKTFKQFYDRVIDETITTNNPARNDKSVRAVMAEFAGRLDMSGAELQNKLNGTEWFQSHTQKQLRWNDLGQAEKDQQVAEQATGLVNTWFQLTGDVIATDDPRIANAAERIASGELGIGKWTETVVKPAAVGNPSSPWSRQITTEQEDQRTRGVTVENTAQKVRDLSQRWGVRLAPSSVQSWASKIVDKTASEADLLLEMQNQSKVLFPWKDPTLETETAAAPWLNTFERVMERQTTINDPKVQAALTAGTPAWAFEQELKKSPEWLGTKNARQEMVSTVAEVGRRLGFV